MCLRFVAILISSHPTITGLYKEEIPKFSYLKKQSTNKNHAITYGHLLPVCLNINCNSYNLNFDVILYNFNYFNIRNFIFCLSFFLNLKWHKNRHDIFFFIYIFKVKVNNTR